MAFPLILYGAARTVGSNSNRIADWLPANLPESVDLKEFDHWFGDGQFVVVSWEGCRIDIDSESGDSDGDDPRLASFASLLMQTDGVEQTNFIKKVITSRTLVETLMGVPMNLSKANSVGRLTGSMIGGEGQGCAIIFLNDFPTENLRDAIGFWNPRWIDRFRNPDLVKQGLVFRTLESCNIPIASAHLGGPPIDNLAINEEGQRTLVRLAIAAGGLGLLLSWWSLRSIRLTLIVFCSGIFSTCGATSAIWLSGCHADAIVLAMPSLIYVLTISGAIHLVNYYRVSVNECGPHAAAARSMAMGMKPATLCSMTTAFGLLSLFASDLTPIRRFGIFSALGMGLMLIALFVLLPAALQYFGHKDGFERKRKHALRKCKTANARSLITTTLNSTLNRGERWKILWVRNVIRHYRLIGFSSLLALIVLATGIPQIHTSVDLLKLFDGRTRILEDYRWLETNLGNLVPLEILVRFDRRVIDDEGAKQIPGTLTMLERVKVVAKVRHEINARFGRRGAGLISTPLSAITFLPPLPNDNHGVSGVMRRQVMDSKLRSSKSALMESGYLAIDSASQDELWRISLRAAAFKDIDFGVLATEVRNVVAPIVSTANQQLATKGSDPSIAAKITVIHTGAIPIVYKAQRALLESLIESTVWSFLTITPLVMWVTMGFGSGFVAMFPNLFPVVAVFGSMGWLGIPVDIGCMMTASIALGVAVDDTIHFLHWYRHCQEHTSDRNAAIEAAFLGCCNPTLQAAVINGLGLSVFLLSTFVPTRQFGLLMLVILSCGAIAELLLLPAILASPLGKCFDIRCRKPGAASGNPTNAIQPKTVARRIHG